MKGEEHDLAACHVLGRRINALEKELRYMREQYAALEARYNALVERLDTLSAWANYVGRKENGQWQAS